MTHREDHKSAIRTGPHCRSQLWPLDSKIKQHQCDKPTTRLMHNHPSSDPTPSRRHLATRSPNAATHRIWFLLFHGIAPNDGVWGASISLGARLCRLAARLAHSGSCGVRHEPGVAEKRAELVSLTETSNGCPRSIGMHARDLAALAGSRADGLDRRQHFLVLWVEARRLPHAEREIRGSDIDTVEALDRDDLVEVLHGLA